MQASVVRKSQYVTSDPEQYVTSDTEHDPDQTDDDLDLKLKQAESILAEHHSKTRCILPQEGDKIIL